MDRDSSTASTLRLAWPVLAFCLTLAVSGPAHADLKPTCLGKPATIVGEGTAHGTAHADVIVTGPGPDQIDGGGGNDRICAGAGDDVISGEEGSDRIDAGPGADTVDGGNGSDHVLGGAGADTIRGRRGNDRLFGGEGARDFVEGGLGDDLVSGGPGDLDQVIGSLGTDRIYGGPGDGDVLSGDHGEDTLDGGPGAHDTVSFALAGDPAVALGGSPGVEGGATVDLTAGVAEAEGEHETLTGIEDVIGTPFPDRILGDAEPNVLYGGGDVDDLDGVGPGDVAIGGSGLDRCLAVEVAESCELPGTVPTTALTEAAEVSRREGLPSGPTFEVDLAGGEGASGVSAVVDHDQFLTEKEDTAISVAFAEGSWIIDERPLPIVAGDRCSLLTPESVSCPASGTPEGFYVRGSRTADTITVEPSVPATAGAVIVGGMGADTIAGGAGDDTIEAWGRASVVRGGPGDDALSGGLLVDGESGSDLLIVEQPCSGATIEGGAGVDSVSFARSRSGVEATLGQTAFGSDREGAPYIRGCLQGGAPTILSDSVESIEGSIHADILRGDGNDNILLGRGGDDQLRGAGGDDFLVGGSGIDELFGGNGADRLYARDGTTDATVDCGGADGDFAVTDPIDPAAVGCRERPT